MAMLMSNFKMTLALALALASVAIGGKAIGYRAARDTHIEIQ